MNYLTIAKSVGLGCYCCRNEAHIRVEFGDDLEYVTQVCSEECGIVLLTRAEKHLRCPSVFTCLAREEGMIMHPDDKPCLVVPA